MMRQLQAIFLIILIAGSSATSLKSTIDSKQSILGDIQDKNSQFYEMLEEGSQFVVDQVLSLLLNLEDAAKKDLVNLNKAWAIEKALLEAIIEKARVAWRTQQAECNRLEAEQHELEHQIKIRIEETEKNNKEIKLDTAKIIKAKKELCESNSMYIDHIIDHRDALLLFGILKKAIAGYTPGSFVQLSEFKQNASTLGDFINIFAQQHAEEFNGIMSQLRQVHAHSSKHSSIKQDFKRHLDMKKSKFSVSKQFKSAKLSHKVVNHASNKRYHQVNRVVDNLDTKGKEIDNKKKQIKLEGLNQDTVRSLAMVKGALIKIIDQLTLVESTKQHTQQVQEQQANENAATFKSHLQDEQRRLTRRNEELKREIGILRVELKHKIIQVKECRVQEATLLKAYKLAQKNLVEATDRYNARRKTLEGEIVLFNRLYKYYKSKVYGVATQSDKARIQDHVNNGNFKRSASYTAHTTSAFNKLQGNAGRTLHAEAERSA